jgi:hypothetical protein
MLRDEFCRMLEIVARLAHFQLTPDVVTFYLDALEPHGIADATVVLRKHAERVTPRTGLPSVAQILAAMGKRELGHEEIARELAERIAGAIRRFGYTQPRRAEEFLGAAGWLTIEKLGGWQNICESTDTDDLPVLKAQWREIARGVLDSSEAPRPKALESADSSKSQRGTIFLVRE